MHRKKRAKGATGYWREINAAERRGARDFSRFVAEHNEKEQVSEGATSLNLTDNHSDKGDRTP